MSTEAQKRANRRNAKKSTGPRTREGKATASKNSIKHGLLAHQTIISSENHADFCKERERILSDLVPESPMESMLAERVVILSWRLKRIDHIQNQTIDALNKRNTSGTLNKLTKSLLFKGQQLPQADSSDPAQDLALGIMAIKDFSNARVLDRLLMYERRIENSLYKTYLEFQRLQLMRKLQNPDGPDQQTQYQSLLGGKV
ncbi:hypothetical protein GWN26_14060 [Candidatus Saccharibacteria bacterium]|nr:hypothetical protein [Candidatus Saccharibacteria bacterium]NIW80523.1 hypothetical protein [Calditrichia bacterium]